MLTGIAKPRLMTPPLGKLSPDNSDGYAVIEFAESIGIELMPWQRGTLIHGLQRGKDGGYRFRTVIVLCSRQNGKSMIPVVLSLYQMLHGDAMMVLGTSTNLETARESWRTAAALAEDELSDHVRKIGYGSITTEIKMWNGARYRISAANRRGGRGISVDLGLADELREHQNWDAWSALSATTTARPDPQIWALSNAGDDSSVVLNHLRDVALGGGDDSVGLLEWSAPEDCDLDDPQAWAQANPALGHTITEAALRSKRASAPPAVFRTEHLCQRVAAMDSVVDMAAWRESADTGTLDNLRDRVALCVDVSLDLQHVTLLAAAKDAEDRVRVDVVAAWDSVQAARRDLPGWLEKIKPRTFGWFPNGPAAALAVDIGAMKGVDPIKAQEISAVCLGLSEQILARRVLHSNDPLLYSQLEGTSKLYSGDGWRFARRGSGHCDAVYALAGAVHLARTLPAPRPKLIVL